MNRCIFLTALFAVLVDVGAAQQNIAPPTEVAPVPPASYSLGPRDQITLYVTNLPDEFTADNTFRLDMDGEVSIPLAGRIHAGGLTTRALEDEIKSRLGKVLKDPEVVVNITEFGSQPASVLGAVNTPGIVQLQGQKNLFEVLSLAGGTTDQAGTRVKITRALRWGPIPLPDSALDQTGHFSVASVKLRGIMNATDPAENITIMPGDTITVPRAEAVYVVGSVAKPGGFPIGENETISTLQAVALAQGLQKTAATNRAKILRATPGSKARIEIAVDLKQLMAGKADDVLLRQDDILFIPDSGAKSAAYRTMDAIVNAATFAARSY